MTYPIKVSAVIMAHPNREDFVGPLRERIGRSTPIVWDTRNDRWETGSRALQTYSPTATHVMVIQDDAIVPNDLTAGVAKALTYVPDNTAVGLYVGKTRPHDAGMKRELAKLPPDTSWLIMEQLYWGVGVVLPVGFVEPMIQWCDLRSDLPNYDRRISQWLYRSGIPVWYPWPSLVDHRDSPSLVRGRTVKGRNAHSFIGAAESALDYDGKGRVVRVNPQAPSVPEPTSTGQRRWRRKA